MTGKVEDPAAAVEIGKESAAIMEVGGIVVGQENANEVAVEALIGGTETRARREEIMERETNAGADPRPLSYQSTQNPTKSTVGK